MTDTAEARTPTFTREELLANNPFLSSKPSFTREELLANNPFLNGPTDFETQIEKTVEEGMLAIAEADSPTSFQGAGQRRRAARVSQADDPKDLEDLMMATRAFVDMQALGFADEIGAGVTSLALKILEPELTKDIPFQELYNQNLEMLDQEKIKWQAENPVETLTFGVAGAFASPVNILGGKLINGWAALRSGRQAATTSANVANTLDSLAFPGVRAPGAAQAAGEAMLRNQQLYSGLPQSVFNVVSKTPTIFPSVAVNAGLGSAYGAGLSDPGTRGQGATSGALLGAAFPLVLKGTGLAANEVTRLRNFQPLGRGSDFIPIALTESKLAPLYKSLVGKSYLGHSLIEGQVRRISSRIATNFSKLEEQAVSFRNAAANHLKNFKYSSDKSKKELLATLKEQADVDLAHLRAGQKGATSEASDLLSERVRYLEEASKLRGSPLNHAALREIDSATNQSEAAFRNLTLGASLPSAADDSFVAALTRGTPQEAIDTLTKEWQSSGFRAAKNHIFTINKDRILSNVDEMLDKDINIRMMLQSSPNPRIVREYMDEVLSGVTGGRINGEALVGLRSDIGVVLNSMTDNKNIVSSAINEVQKYIDDIITSQLPEAAKKSFLDDRFRWATFKTAEAAVFRATKGASPGVYTAEDWVAANKEAGRFFSTRGKAPFQSEAQSQLALNSQRDSAIRATADASTEEMVEALSKKIQTEKAYFRQAKRELNKQYTDTIAAIKRNYSRNTTAVKDTAESAMKRSKALLEYKEQSRALDQHLEAVENYQKWFRGAMPNASPSTFEQLFASGVLGQVAKELIGDPGWMDTTARTIATGIGAAKVLSLEPVQRALVGQTGAQQAANRALQSMSTVRPPLAAAAGSAGSPRVPEYTEQAKRTILATPERSRRRLEALREEGTLELLRRRDPEFVADMERVAGQ